MSQKCECTAKTFGIYASSEKLALANEWQNLGDTLEPKRHHCWFAQKQTVYTSLCDGKLQHICYQIQLLYDSNCSIVSKWAANPLTLGKADYWFLLPWRSKEWRHYDLSCYVKPFFRCVPLPFTTTTGKHNEILGFVQNYSKHLKQKPFFDIHLWQYCTPVPHTCEKISEKLDGNAVARSWESLFRNY